MTGLTSAWTQLRPHAVQRQLWTSPERFVAVPAGRGSGKTELAKRRLVRYLPVRKPWGDPRYFYAAPTREQAKRIAWEHLKALVPNHWLAGEPSESSLVIRTKFGSTLHVVGMDKPQRIEGLQWDGGVMDESCDQKPKVFDRTVLPMLTWRNAWCWRIGVPKRQGVGAAEFRAFFEKAVRGELEGTVGFTWPSSTVLSPDQLAYARTTMDLKDYLEQFDARWQQAGGGVFHAFSREHNVRPVAYDPSKAIVVGSDFNVDPMCWCVGHRRGDHLEFFDEVVLRNTNTVSALDVLYQRYNSHEAGFEFYGDATGRARKTSASRSDYQLIMNHLGFQKAGRTVHYPRGNPRVQDRFAACNALLCNAAGERHMFIDPRCKHVIADLEARTYKQGSREPDDSADVGHMTDALGYAVHRLFPMRVLLGFDVPEVGIRK